MEWLANAHLSQFHIIDYGCGSGILAIAALKLGATAAITVDHDPQALLATQENATRNGVVSRLQVSFPSELIEIKTDFLIANILAEPLLKLAPLFARLTYPDAYLVLSGITSDQIQQILQTYNDWFTFSTPMIRENWVLLAGHRR